jgi:hypothetical protein
MRPHLSSLTAAVALAACVLTASPPEAAAQTEPDLVFVYVKHVRERSDRIFIGGIREGSDEVEVYQTPYFHRERHLAACMRYAQLMMAKPGKFRLGVYATTAGGTAIHCGLTLIDGND